MEITLFGAAKEVTGSCCSISANNEKILIDCGMFQGGKDTERKNYEDFGFNPKEYSAIILTHAHLDHSGRIPKLVRQGFRGKIYATDVTKALAEIIMSDAAKIAAQDTENENKRRVKQGLSKRKPIYNEEDVKNTLKLFRTVNYGQDIEITKSLSAKFYNAGHILGASSVQVKINEGNKETIIAFSSDLGQPNALIVKNTELIKKADYVFIESTYGDRIHPPIDEREKELLRVIKEAYNRRGKLMIPSFAVDRTQELLYLIGKFQRQGMIPKMPVYLDSPMAIKATAVFTKYSDYYNEDIMKSLKERGEAFNFPNLIYTEKVEESKKINSVTTPCIIIAGNGMCSAGRIKYHIANNIEDTKNTLLFIGFQAQGTLGYWIKKGEKKIKLLGKELNVNAKIESIEGFSAHADYNQLLAWIKNFSPKPKTFFIVHGEEKQSAAFSKRLEKEGIKTYIPQLDEKIVL